MRAAHACKAFNTHGVLCPLRLTLRHNIAPIALNIDTQETKAFNTHGVLCPLRLTLRHNIAPIALNIDTQETHPATSGRQQLVPHRLS
jgi:hypothetical protein